MTRNQTLCLGSIFTQITKLLKPILLLILIFSGLITFASNQSEITVNGTIKDPSGIPLPGVTVIVKGTTNGSITDIDGKYTLSKVPTEGTLVFSFIGMKKQETPVNGKTTINVTMEEISIGVDEVVVVGYGTMKKKDLTGSSVSVKADKIANIPVTTAAQALTGKAAGVSIVTQNGAPGADINILVRGGTSITQSTKPLYIVDGFQMENGLQNIAINDIKSIDVMKDASATAIYGARGSNGVILITTKSASKGKTEVNYNSYISFEKLGKELDVLDVQDYVKYQYEFQTLAGNENRWAEMFGGNIENPDFYNGAYNRIKEEYASRKGIDWQDIVFGNTGVTQNHNISVSGGNDKTKFLLSYNYTGQEGILDKHDYTRNSIRAKINHELRDNIHLDFSTSFQGTEVDGGGKLGGTLKYTILQPPTGGTKYTNEEMINNDINADMLTIDPQYDLYNPLISNDAVTHEKFTRLFTTNAGIEIDFLKDFTFRTAGSYMWKQTRNDYWDDGRTKQAENYNGPFGYRNNNEKFSWQITNTLTWEKTYKIHRFNAMLGQETYYDESMKLDNEYHEFPDNNFGLNDVNMGTSYSMESSKSTTGLVSFFGRLVYSYADRYMITGTLRGDGSSKFARGNQWGFFPSVSGAWRISEESFMANQNIFDNLKLRIGYGTSGNNNIDNNMYATDYKAGHYAIKDADFSTLVPGDIVGNEKLKWETVTTTNLGLDMTILQNRINFSVDLYRNKSKSLLIKNSIPTSTGYAYQFQNIGSVRNQGAEFVLNTRNIKKKNFTWNTDFNISFNRSKILEIYGNSNNDYFLKDYEQVDFLVEVGKPLGQIYGYKYDGVYTTDDFIQTGDDSYSLKDGVASLKGLDRSSIKPGDVKYKTTADQTDSDGNPVWSTDDRTVIGNAEPKFAGGFNNTFTYKNFDLSIFMNFVYGNDIFNMSSQRFIGPYLPNQNTLTDMNGRFRLVDQETGKEATSLERLAAMNPQQYRGNAMWSLNSENKIAITDALSYYVEDGSFLRINNITFGYSLPLNLLNKVHISKLRVYCTLNNIYTFTDYSGYDPEVSATSSMLTRGVDNSSYPRSKSYVFGLNLTF